MEVSTHDESTRSEDVVVQTPEVLHRVEGVHAAQGLSPGGLLLPPIGVVKPERPGVLKRVLLVKIGSRLRHVCATSCKEICFGNSSSVAREDAR